MKRIFQWLERKISPESDGSSTAVEDTPNVEDVQNDNDHTSTVPTLTTLDESSFLVVEETGFDPYNSGSFESSKSRLRKKGRG